MLESTCGGVAELADASDSKSLEGNLLWVRFPPPLPIFHMKLLLAAVLAALAAAPSFADDVSSPPASPPPAKKWKDSAEASFVNANGNSKAATTSGKEAFSYQFDGKTKLDLEGGGLGSRSQGVVTAEQYYALEKGERLWDARDYVFEQYRWDRNRFARIAHRHDASVGVGREIRKTKQDLWTAEAGPGYVIEQRIGDSRRNFAASRLYTKFSHDFSPTASFSQDAEYIQSLKDKRDNRFNTETALKTTLTTVFSVKTSFVWKHASQPPPDAVKDDTITSVALIANF